MSSTLGDRGKLLGRVEILLEQSPIGQDDILHELQQELGALRKEMDTDALEKVFQLFGTAVGQQSRSAI
jgi:hypothetical protein